MDVEVALPNGREAAKREHVGEVTEIGIKVPNDQAGKVWSLRLQPTEDVSIQLCGDVNPYPGPQPNSVLTWR